MIIQSKSHLKLLCCSSLSKLTASEVGKLVVTSVTDQPTLFNFILRDVTSSQQDVQITALQMLAACLHCDVLIR